MEYQYLSEFLTIMVVHVLGVASPGPDFAIVLRQSITHGKKTAIFTSIGVGLAILIHVFYSLLGIGLLISQSIVAFNIMKFAAAGYLLFIGIKAIRARPAEMQTDLPQVEKATPSMKRALWTGFLTNGLNPKVALFFLSLFTVVINPNTPVLIQAGYGLYMSVATMVWFTGISLVFSHPKVRNGFKKLGHWFDRAMGVILIGLGLKIATSSLP